MSKEVTLFKSSSLKDKHDVMVCINTNMVTSIDDDFIRISIEGGDSVSLTQRWCGSKQYGSDYFVDGDSHTVRTVGSKLLAVCFLLIVFFSLAAFLVLNSIWLLLPIVLVVFFFC